MHAAIRPRITAAALSQVSLNRIPPVPPARTVTFPRDAAGHQSPRSDTQGSTQAERQQAHAPEWREAHESEGPWSTN